MPKKKKAVRRRNRFKPVEDVAHPQRKLLTRLEAAHVAGCSIQTIKRMEKRYGGTLDQVKLRGPMSQTYYKVDQLNEAFGLDINVSINAAIAKDSKAA